jgi:tetratricopeptide (TPR) repeat protein
MVQKLAAFLIASAVAISADAACPSADAVAFVEQADAIVNTNVAGAIALLEHATQLDALNPRIFYKLARACARNEDWAKTATAAGTAAQLAPDFASYHALQGLALVRQEAWPDAKTALENAVRIDPLLADAHLDLATTLEHLHDEQGALDHYVKAIRAAPSKPDAYIALGDLYFRLGYADRARALVREAMTWSPPPHPHFLLATLAGALAEERHAMPDALAAYQEALTACGTCSERSEAIAFFNVGAALAMSKPPQKVEAAANLHSFQKRICKGGLAMRYADECMQTAELLKRVGSP